MRLLAVVLALGMVFPPGLLADAQPSASQARDYSQISLEELLNKDITVAATKTRVDVARAPVSVTVLTPDDVRRSGAANLGELLRTVPGLDVLESFPSYISVSARGTSESFVNNMLVLIDGRRFETLLAGVPFLDEMPIRMEDIKRIEVVKGPVGALYGTNALAGVISITTFGASDVPGTFVSLTGGQRDTMEATVRQAGSLGNGWAYKFSGGYNYSSTWGSLSDGDTQPPLALRKGSGSLLIERRLGDGGLLEIEGGYVKGDLASLTIVTNQTQYFTMPHGRISYSRPDFHVALTTSPQALELRERVPPVQPLTDRWSGQTNLAVDRTLRPFTSSTLTVGGNVRHQRSNSTNLGGVAHSQVVGAVFAQNEQSLVKDRLALFGAIGLSHHPEIPLQVDGNVALVATIVKDHTLRASYGRAHRDPSFGENFINFARRIGPADGYQIPNLDLAPESIRAVEVGYRGRVPLGGTTRLTLFADAFQEELRDLINLVTTPVSPGSVPDRPTVTITQQFQNSDARDGRGFEVGAELEAASLRLVGQYSYQEFENATTGAKILADIPTHKVSGAVRTQVGPVELDLWVHSVSRTVNPTVGPDEDGYVLLNPRLGVKAGRFLFAAQAFNALDDKHLETANGRGIKGETLRRLVTFNVRYTP
jgi:iron complex outermembrane recepter protein